MEEEAGRGVLSRAGGPAHEVLHVGTVMGT